MNIEKIKENGIIGAGGAGFPAHIKLDAHPDTLIMNAAECEPLLHKDMEMLRQYSDQILNGFKMAMDITGAKKGIIGIKEKHSDVIDLLKSKVNSNITVCPLGDFYPAGDEITLIYLTTRRVVQPGGLPISVGCVVQNVETLYNISTGFPVADKFISVAGAVESPATIKVPVGISFKEILSQFKMQANQYVVISGGLMMGRIEEDLDQAVSKRDGALVVLPADHHCITMYQRYATEHDTDRLAKASCDQCTFCTEFCPRYLLGHPVRPEIAMRNRMFAEEGQAVADLGSSFCCECNLCTLYACPESLDPRGATVIEKRILAENNQRWEGLPVSPHPMMDFRKVPTKKLMQRLDVLQFQDSGPMTDLDLQPQFVKIGLDQHIGAVAQSTVSVGSLVKKYDLIAKATGKISSNIHASIDGRVTQVNNREIMIERSK